MVGRDPVDKTFAGADLSLRPQQSTLLPMSWWVVGLIYVHVGVLVLLHQVRKRPGRQNLGSIGALFAEDDWMGIIQLALFWPLFYGLDRFERYCMERFENEEKENASRRARESADRAAFEQEHLGLLATTRSAMRPLGKVEVEGSKIHLSAKSLQGLIPPHTAVRIEGFDDHGNALVRPD
jgi:hypothetical protein